MRGSARRALKRRCVSSDRARRKRARLKRAVRANTQTQIKQDRTAAGKKRTGTAAKIAALVSVRSRGHGRHVAWKGTGERKFPPYHANVAAVSSSLDNQNVVIHCAG
eukprot:2730760-Pleurochrysis_carterae.AAC.1